MSVVNLKRKRDPESMIYFTPMMQLKSDDKSSFSKTYPYNGNVSVHCSEQVYEALGPDTWRMLEYCYFKGEEERREESELREAVVAFRTQFSEEHPQEEGGKAILDARDFVSAMTSMYPEAFSQDEQVVAKCHDYVQSKLKWMYRSIRRAYNIEDAKEEEEEEAEEKGTQEDTKEE